MKPDVRERLEALSRTPVLLVACDYDGTLSELVRDPSRAAAHAGALGALRGLVSAGWTTTAVISGRVYADLVSFLGSPLPTIVVGSHGAEWSGVGVGLSAEQSGLLSRVTEAARGVASRHDGVLVEIKPAGVAVHVRGVPGGSAVVREAEGACGSMVGVLTRHGSEVVEFTVVPSDKGEALRRARYASGATGVLFVGDDITDEDAFRALSPGDVGIKVGEGETAAGLRIGGVGEVAEVLEALLGMRRSWAASRGLVPLERCAVISDQRTLAVVSPGARVSWLCMPRIDSGSIFASLVGDASSGEFSIGPAEGLRAGEPAVAYEGDSMVLRTSWPSLVVRDYLDCSGGRAFQKAGRVDLVRVIEGNAAGSRAVVRFGPRLDFGRLATRLRVRPDGLEVEGSNDPIVLRSPGVEWRIVEEGVHQSAEAEVDASRGPVVLELRYGSGSLRAGLETEEERLEQNVRFWSGWARSLKLPAVARELVKRSALVLRALSHGPTGVIAAAATTSLPEHMGGGRNWDYRFCWPRDAALSSAALVRLGNTGLALKFLDWMLDVVDRCESPDRLRPIYTVTGGHLPPEGEVSSLCGYGESRPVRIGNAAANQVQLDVFGPIVDLVAMLAERGAPIAPDHWRLVRAMVRAVQSRWEEPDHGIWEMRLERRHHVHSKAMCWHTVARGLVVEEAVCGTRSDEWEALASAIRTDVLAKGWNERVGAFTGAYGYDYPDAAVLVIGLTGLIDRGDPRWVATVEMVSRTLREGPTVRRYRADDGLAGDEGGMHICTGWLIESLASVGRLDEAAGLFGAMCALAGEAGVMTEQHDPVHGIALGNLAQAYSHLAVINAAVALERAGVVASPPGASASGGV
ncbi:MAG: trehalose-phosphatase [Phycisphaeraceae bacterium]|nr:MAG: trehalose-phosphatase [Phycisphaeraceae bacterium]